MREVQVERLSKVCEPESIGCSASDEMKPLDTIIGQDRAVRALGLGLMPCGWLWRVSCPWNA